MHGSNYAMSLAQQETLSIKVTIAEMVFPLKIHPDEEEVTRRAAKWINERIIHYRDQFQIKDKSMLLAMCALQLGTELFSQEATHHMVDQELHEGIARLHHLVFERAAADAPDAEGPAPEPSS